MTASKIVFHLEETRFSKDDVEALLKGAASSSVHRSDATIVWDFNNSYNFAIVNLKVMSGFMKPENESTQEIIANNMDWVLTNLDQRSVGNKTQNADNVAFQASVIIRGLFAENEKLKLDSAPI